MSTITKLRKLPDGSLEHFTESTATPASLNALATAMLAKSKAQMLNNVQPDPFEGREVVRVGLMPTAPPGEVWDVDPIVKNIRTGPAKREFAEPFTTVDAERERQRQRDERRAQQSTKNAASPAPEPQGRRFAEPTPYWELESK